jgi:hypothetical protein
LADLAGAANDSRLERGPAYSNPDIRHSSPPVLPSDWPTYRGDAARSGSSDAGLALPLAPVWTAEVGGRLSGITVGADKVYVAQVDRHTVVALDAADGHLAWQYTAAGRVDSPPTLHQGLVLFGSADGSVYCLQAADGRLVWRFRAAPQAMVAVAHEQIESLWPVHGSVLIHNGLAYVAAGRSSYLDGGIYLYALDPATGEVIHQQRLADQHVGAFDLQAEAAGDLAEQRFSQNAVDRKTLEAADRSDAFAMRGALTDVISADANSIYMRHLRFDATLIPREQQSPHLFSTSNLLDDTEHHRSYWVLGTGDFSRTPVAYPWIVPKNLAVPYGLLLAFDEQTVWGIRRGGSRDYKQGYALFAMPRPDPQETAAALPDFAPRQTALPTASWTVELSMRPRALIRAGQQLVVGGLAAQSPTPPGPQDQGHVHVAAGRDGAVQQQLALAAVPVWDGLAAARGCLYVALVDGTVVRLGTGRAAR